MDYSVLESASKKALEERRKAVEEQASQRVSAPTPPRILSYLSQGGVPEPLPSAYPFSPQSCTLCGRLPP